MLNVDQALETILSHMSPLAEEECSLLDSLGRIATDDIYAGIDVPGWDSAAMDGYAVQALDTKGASQRKPCILKVIDKAAAGSVAKHKVSPGTAVRIMTGAQIPPGADCVVRFEDTDEEMRRQGSSAAGKMEIGIRSEGYSGMNIRRAGEMVAEGARAIGKGIAIGPGDLGVLASLGLTHIKVIRRPAVAIIATGNELVDPGKLLSNSRLYSSGSFSLAAQVKHAGGIPEIPGIAKDNIQSIISKIHRGIKADAIITCGGSSAGDYDLVKEVIAEMGEVIFWGVNMSPGKTFSFGLIEDKWNQKENRIIPHFGLVGHPSAGMVNFEVLVHPALLKMQGKTRVFPKLTEVTLQDVFENGKQARCFVWAQISQQNNSYLT